MKADAGGLVASKRSEDGRELFSSFHFGMDDGGNYRMNFQRKGQPVPGLPAS
jgi:hypothetical protein